MSAVVQWKIVYWKEQEYKQYQFTKDESANTNCYKQCIESIAFMSMRANYGLRTWISRNSCMQILSVSDMMLSEESVLAPTRLCAPWRSLCNEDSVFLAFILERSNMRNSYVESEIIGR